MKKLLTILICSAGLSVAALAQGPGAVPPSTPMTTVAPIPTASAAASLSPGESEDSTTLAGRIHNKVSKNLHNKGIHFDINTDSDSDTDTTHGRSHSESKDIPDNVIPIVGLAVLGVFGGPVFIFALLLYFAFSRNRVMHRTIRLMVEKGQPVPEALLNPPPHVRKRSDMRRGVILLMIGIGLTLFFGAVNDWDNGAWTLGLIPLLIGVGYLLVWKLEGSPDGQAKADNPPPLP
jgi:hypothetical protein